MQVQFELTVKVTGHNLQEIDDGLVQAAGERLKARILQTMGAAPTGMPAGLNVKMPPPPTPIKLSPEAETAIDMAEKNALPTASPVVNTLNAKNPLAPPPPPMDAVTPKSTGAKRGPKPKSEKGGSDEKSHSEKSEAESQGSGQASQKEVGSSPASSEASGPPKVLRTYEEAMKVLSAVNSKHNMDVARECLSRFGISKLSVLKDTPQKFGEFIEYAEVILAKDPIPMVHG